jgi:GT2 family glycosyltransferase
MDVLSSAESPGAEPLDRTVLLVASLYKNPDEVRAFVDHVFELPLPPGWRLALAISDNSESWSGLDPRPQATMVQPRANLGYLGGCSFAFDAWCAQHGGVPAWTGVVNTDLELDTQFFMKLLTTDLPAETGILAPAVHLPDGTHQNPFLRQRPSMFRMLALRLVFRAAWLTWAWTLAHEVRRRTRPHTRVGGTRAKQQIYAPHGAAMFFRRSFFERGGELRFGSFMFGEELHIAEQARRREIGVVYEPACSVLHNAHAVVGQLPSATSRAWRAQSSDYIWSTYFRWGAAG